LAHPSADISIGIYPPKQINGHAISALHSNLEINSDEENVVQAVAINAMREARSIRDVFSLPLPGSTNVQTANGYTDPNF
jgi:hypothetical protein